MKFNPVILTLIPWLALSACGADTNSTSMAGMDMGQAAPETKTHLSMHGWYGPYRMSRESSGTAWEPEATPMEGIHIMHGDWMFMFHGFAFGIYDFQGGHRGDDKWISENMAMAMAQHPLGPGTFGVRTMLTLEPATVGKDGYPELLQTGETANGKTPLVDRQHPHDMFMELAATYSVPVGDNSSVFTYFGLPGEPALGPATFMHRFTGIDDPEAPLTHHWLDSTHVTFGVATLGYVWKDFKVDGSIFTGREPDQNRWNIERPRFDSYSIRLTYNPAPPWSMQVSYGNIHSPEQLETDVNVQRVTASVTYHYAWDENHWETMFAWGRNIDNPGRIQDGFLLESKIVFHQTHTIFGRIERVDKSELFPVTDARFDNDYTINRFSLGYIYDFPRWMHIKVGIGGVGSVYALPSSLDAAYGDTPVSLMAFIRLKF